MVVRLHADARAMKALLIDLFGSLFYTSGFLIWPLCVFLWRKQKPRTTALRWLFFGELVCFAAVGGLALSSAVHLEHGYYWCIILIVVNVIFTVLALGAAIYDYDESRRGAA